MIRRQRIRTAALLATVLLVLLTGCALEAPTTAAPGTADKIEIEPGAGTFTFDGYPPLADRPVRVWYSAPKNPATARILVVLHGVERNAREYRADWDAVVDRDDVLVLAPEFDEDDYPGSASFNLGNVVDEDERLRPPQEWSFHVVEALFDAVVADVGGTQRDYAMYGHSAGAQFVHRFVEFMPEQRVRVAVAANAGWYTVPDDDIEFPYGLDGGPVQESALRRAFGTELVVLLGGDDIDADGDNLRTDDGADAQGHTRLERGWHFYQQARVAALRNDLPLRWRLAVAPGVGHSHAEMARAAVPYLLTGALGPG